MVRRCSYLNCNSVYSFGSQLTFFRFPSDGRRDLWILHCGGAAFQSKTATIKNIFICSKHFRSEDISYHGTKSNLVNSAIPLPFDDSFCKCNDYMLDPLCVSKSSPKPRKRKLNATTSIIQDYSSTLPDLTGTYSPPSPEILVRRSENVKTYIRDYSIPKTPERHTPSPSQFLEPPRKRIASPIDSPVKVDVCEHNDVTKKKQTNNENIINSIESKPKDVKAFIKAQLFHKSGPGREWTQDEKNVFLKIYFKSPSCYKAMQNMGFSMPHISTLVRWQSEIVFSPGINTSIINLLKYKCEGWGPSEKKCILLFDEMAIKTELEYNSREDIIYGLTDLGNGDRSGKIASSALLIMVRGLNLNWKQCIAYYVGALNADKLKNTILNIIEILHDIGLDVEGITCDQGSVNRKVYKNLGCTNTKPFIECRGRKIAVLYDPVHLIKSIRNCLLKGDINCEGKKISWKIVEKIYQEDKYKILRNCFKLTDKHVYPDNFDKLSVKLAVQVFSRQVALGIKLALDFNIFSEEDIETAKYTAESFQKLNDLFDNFNSVAKYSDNPQRCALSEDTDKVLKNLSECRTWIEKWEHLGKMKRPYCFDGMLQTINGVLHIWENVRISQNYLITSHINQDPLENCISVLRRCKGSYERNPSALRLSRNLRQVAFQNLIPSLHTGYNISNDVTLLENNFATTANENKLEIAEDIQNVETEISEGVQADEEFPDIANFIEETLPFQSTADITDNDTFSLDESILVYFSGYIAHKVECLYKCSVCQAYMLRLNEEEKISDHLLKLKAYKVASNNSPYGNLKVPSQQFIKIVKRIYYIFGKYIATLKHETEISRKLVDIINNFVALSFCPEHNTATVNFIIEVLIRFYAKKSNHVLSTKLHNRRDRLRILEGN